MLEKMRLEYYFYELTQDDYINLIKRRLPVALKNEDISIICFKQGDRNIFIDVGFYFVNATEPREAFYTHFYQKEIEDYIKEK